MCLNDMLLTRSFRVGSAEPQVIDPVIQNVQPRRHSRQATHTQADVPRQIQPAQTIHSHSQTIGPLTGGPVDQIVHNQNAYPYQVYTTPLHPGPRGMHPATAGPPQSWQGPNSIAPQQTHMAPQMLPRPQPYRDDSWDGSYDHSSQGAGPIVGGPNSASYDYRYRDDQTGWVGGPNDYYDPSASAVVIGLQPKLVTFYPGSNMINPMTSRRSTCPKLVHRILDLLRGLPQTYQTKPVVASVIEFRSVAHVS
jgi:hypothetical protein